MEIKIHPTLGWPIVTAQNCFDTILALGIKPWRETKAPLPLEEYLKEAGEAQRTETQRFGPKCLAVFYEDPKGRPFTGFRTIHKVSCTVFTPLGGDYIPITAEWKHGNEKITLVPPSGVPGKAEAGLELPLAMSCTALREFREETGITLEGVRLLGPENGIWSAVRPSETRFFGYLGIPAEPIARRPSKLDDTEHLKMLLFPLEEWLTLITSNKIHPAFGIESCAIDVTYLGLAALGRLQLLS